MIQRAVYRRIAAWILIGIALASLSGCAVPHTFTGTMLDQPDMAHDFTLTDQNGQPFTLSEQRGNVVVMFFGFTHCPDVCPTTLSDMAAVKRKLGGEADKLKVVFVTVDPERDTPEALATYMTSFDPGFIGLSGSREALERVYSDYGVTAIKRELPGSALGYTMDHSAYTYVIDKAGKFRMLFDYGTPVNDVASDLSYLIQYN